MFFVTIINKICIAFENHLQEAHRANIFKYTRGLFVPECLRTKSK